jgi:hypothetical protein
VLFLIRGVTKRHIIYPILNAIAASCSLIIIKNRDISFNCSANIEALSITFPAFMLNPARAIDRFSAVYSAFTRSLL